jgi:hypothetical protein
MAATNFGLRYMKSLCAQTNEGKTASSQSRKAKLGNKMAPIDLNDDDDGDESMMDKEAKFAEQLSKVLTGCQLCGNEKYCIFLVMGSMSI